MIVYYTQEFIFGGIFSVDASSLSLKVIWSNLPCFTLKLTIIQAFIAFSTKVTASSMIVLNSLLLITSECFHASGLWQCDQTLFFMQNCSEHNMKWKVILKWQDVLVHRASYTVGDGICAYEWKERDWKLYRFLYSRTKDSPGRLISGLLCNFSSFHAGFFSLFQVFDSWSKYLHTYIQCVSYIFTCTYFFLIIGVFHL